MKRSIRIVSAAVILALVTFGMINIADAAYASDSVTVPGQVTVDQCPVGFQYSTGLEARIGVGIFTICNAPPNAADLLKQQQDAEFQSRINDAQAAAAAESAAWNAANPGFQKCITWGPVVHANGVSTASGSACANVVASAEPISTEQTDPIVDNTVLPTLASSFPVGQPFTVDILGQHAVEDCPVGYQGANGLSVNVTTHVETTTCWAPAAWAAWRIGGDTWTQFVASGGAYNPQNEINREAAVSALKARALATAQAAADLVPGSQRCTSWSGYGESGNECAHSFKTPAASLGSTPTPSSSATPSPEASTAVDASDPVVQSAAAKLLASVSAVAGQSKAKTISLPTSSLATIKYSSKSTSVCSIVGNKVVRKTAGTCIVVATVTDATGLKFTSSKKVIFTK